MKRILVTGGAGYIGSHAVRALIGAGYDVVVADNLINGHFEFVPQVIEFHKIDIGDEKGLSLIFDKALRCGRPFDAVMHFAGFIEAGLSMKEPFKFFDNNCNKGAVLLEVMRKFKVKNIIFSSTAAVYGDPVNVPIKEDDPLVPTNFYGETKLFFEKMLQVYERAYGFKSVSLRYFNAAGAAGDASIGEWHDPETHLIPRVLKTAMGYYDQMEIFGTDYDTKDGTCVRDYIHVVDLVKAHVLALEYLFEKKKSDVFNLGNGRGFTVKEVVELAKKVSGVDFKVVESKRRFGDPQTLVADCGKAKKILGWNPLHFDLEDIISSAWNWHAKHTSRHEGLVSKIDEVVVEKKRAF